ncbi:MAG TPA: PQ-loop domain-containing transporter [Microlunatus sp.]|nr:PQ-loop domain-containing transporter [Microlunatus sp.]
MFIEALGWAAAVLGAGVALPQVIRLFQTRTTAGLSAPAWQATLGANLAWLAHGLLTGHANIWLPNLCYLLITMIILVRLIVDRRLGWVATFGPGLMLGLASIVLDVAVGPVAFAIAALVPAAFTQLAQFRALVISHNVAAVSMTFLILNVVNQMLWLSWGLLVVEPSIIICASALGMLMLANLAWGSLRRYGLVRARLSELSA